MRFYKPQKGGAELPSLNNPASGSEILSGYQAVNGAGGLVTGSHVCAGLDETTADATAEAGDILAGKTAYSKGQKITGSHSCQTLTQMTNEATAGAGDILAGKTAYSKGQKITGSHVCPTVADLTADADATAGDIAQGKTAYVDGVKVVGTLTAKGEWSYKILDVSGSATTLDVSGYSMAYVCFSAGNSGNTAGIQQVYEVDIPANTATSLGGYYANRFAASCSGGILSLSQSWSSSSKIKCFVVMVK